MVERPWEDPGHYYAIILEQNRRGGVWLLMFAGLGSDNRH
jgi:hypothetical protein